MEKRKLKIFKSLHSDNSIDRIKDTSLVKAVLVLFIAMSSLTKLYADNETVEISRQPAGATTIVADFVGVYTFKYMLNGYICTCAPEFTVTVTQGAPPTINISGTTDICYGMSTTLTATAPGVNNPVFRWYRSQTETTPFHIGDTYTTSALTADSTFYVSVSGDNYYENLPGRKRKSYGDDFRPQHAGKGFLFVVRG
jgi:hypothetical protein